MRTPLVVGFLRALAWTGWISDETVIADLARIFARDRPHCVIANDPTAPRGNPSPATAALEIALAFVLAKHPVSVLLLGRRHAGVERLEGRDEFPQSIGMLVGDDLKGFEIVDRSARIRAGRSIGNVGAKGRCVVPHDLSDVVPQRFLRGRNLQPAAQFLDPGLARLCETLVARCAGFLSLGAMLDSASLRRDGRKKCAEEHDGDDAAFGSKLAYPVVTHTR